MCLILIKFLNYHNMIKKILILIFKKLLKMFQKKATDCVRKL
ncbi:hypothetical protein HMPREF1425_00360 [Helicobacter pylori GAM71Ai]|nr:hypothetical protein HMPREF1392_00157 [Helicobacter pylori GAM101Biv]EMH04930.1 hypothetical protein HMPREF1406_00276 [Helicobacter pylori GAM239Bi]EMH36888.1 hypothetical protein HMPREF1425_00360 [Helicobacter pylori GAM71Ai]EMJ44821.1 hypothetical protein HMPREF1434_00216 [Helicobacter pylori GAMchJs124i]